MLISKEIGIFASHSCDVPTGLKDFPFQSITGSVLPLR